MALEVERCMTPPWMCRPLIGCTGSLGGASPPNPPDWEGRQLPQPPRHRDISKTRQVASHGWGLDQVSAPSAAMLSRPKEAFSGHRGLEQEGVEPLESLFQEKEVELLKAPLFKGGGGDRTGRPAIFLDKDGTLIVDVPYNVDPQRIQLQSGAAEGVQRLQQAGYALVIISNQSGVARGYFAETALDAVEQRLTELLGVSLSGFYYCPHHPTGVVPEYAIACSCRKPEPGMLLQAAADLHLNLAQSWMIGDILNDVEAAHRAGCRAILIDNGNETEWQMGKGRSPDYTAPDINTAADLILQTTPHLVPVDDFRSTHRFNADVPRSLRPSPRAGGR